MKLFQHFEDSGYPTEYLLARIRGRRVHLLKNWDEAILSPEPLNYLLSLRCGEMLSIYSNEGIWKCLLKEYKWVFLQMNGMLREVFHPFFVYHEIKTLISCLRYRTGKETGTEIEELLHFSLLSEEIKEILMNKTDLLNIIDELTGILSGDLCRFNGLEEAFSKNGLKGLEQKLYAALLEYLISTGLHPSIKLFFTRLIDIKNIIAVYKYLRWDITGPPEFISGGNISGSKLRQLSHAHNISELAPLVNQFTGISAPIIITSSIEAILLTGLTKQVQIIKRGNSGIGLILDYLWKVFIETHNLSIILYGSEIDRDVLREELITP